MTGMMSAATSVSPRRSATVSQTSSNAINMSTPITSHVLTRDFFSLLIVIEF